MNDELLPPISCYTWWGVAVHEAGHAVAYIHAAMAIHGNPCLCIHGTSTPLQFWEAVSSASAEDGLLPRMILFDVKGKKPAPVEPSRRAADIPMLLLERLIHMGGIDIVEHRLAGTQARVGKASERATIIRWTPDAEMRFAALRAVVDTQEPLLPPEAQPFIVGIPTVCFGETRGVKMGDKYTVEECKAMLGDALVEFETGMRACLKAPDAIPDKPYAAMVSVTYNIGTGGFCGSTMARKLNAGDIRGACNALPAWNKAGGKAVAGLTRRRQEERALCLEGAG